MPTQPNSMNYASTNKYQLVFDRLPTACYNCQKVRFPDFSLGKIDVTSRTKTIPLPSTEVMFSDMNFDFILDENFQNWYEIANWMMALGFSDDFSEFQNYKDAMELHGENVDFSTATLVVYDNNNNPTHRFNFEDCFPSGMSGFDMSEATDDKIVISLTIAFSNITMESLI